MKCALCKDKQANKKNTHFLTDSIIRTCLNENGENTREKGFYFDISNDSAFVDFNFQRKTTIEKLTKTLGREPNEEEIEKAKVIPFSVDYVFCSDCESRFTEIEEKFTNKYLSRFRDADIGEMDSVAIDSAIIVKSFFLLQVWRTSICDDMFQISDETSEKLRLIILNNNEVKLETLNEFPLAVTYLETCEGDGGYTSNYVGYTDDRNPNLIIMNDFIIQFFPNVQSVVFFDFYNLNKQEDYKMYLNMDSVNFTFKIIKHRERLQLLKEFIINDKIKELTKIYLYDFSNLWLVLFGNYPSRYLVSQYFTHITQGSQENLLHYSVDNILALRRQFIENQLQ